jgi:hypothetical protein
LVTRNGKYGFIDRTGKEIISPQYESANSFSEGLASVGNSKFGFIDKTGKVIIEFKYDVNYNFSDSSFKNGFARVTLNGNEIYIDKNGTEYYEP